MAVVSSQFSIAQANDFRRLQYWYEFLLAANFALVARLTEAQLTFSDAEVEIKHIVNAYFHKHPHADLGGWTAFFLLALLMTFCIFLLIRILSLNRFARGIIRAIGAFSLMGLPIFWLFITHLLERGPVGINPPHVWLFLELGVCGGCALLYFVGRFRVPSWLSIILILAHFGFWSWLLFGKLFIIFPSRLIFPIAGLCSTLAWAMYVARSRQSTETKVT